MTVLTGIDGAITYADVKTTITDGHIERLEFPSEIMPKYKYCLITDELSEDGQTLWAFAGETPQELSVAVAIKMNGELVNPTKDGLAKAVKELLDRTST